MDFEHAGLNRLCELCKKDFPCDAPWPCFDTNPSIGKGPGFRKSTLKHMRDSSAYGCHICSMLKARLRENDDYFDDDFDNMSDDHPYELWISKNKYQDEDMNPVCWFLDVMVDSMPAFYYSATLLLSQVTGKRLRENFGNITWEMDIASSTHGPSLQTVAVQSTSPYSVGSHTIAQISEWLHTCENEHEQCKVNMWLPADQNTYNFRLIHIGNGDASTVHLVDASDLGHLPRYTTLSHRWSKATEDTQLTWANVEQHYKRIDTTPWPQVYKDALLYTRKLNISYLWIDSICIIQDSKVSLLRQDWDEQSTLMSQIYANGVLNLVDLAERNGNGFTVRRNVLTEFPCVLSYGQRRDHSTVSSYLCYSSEYYRQAVSISPLSKRGWVFQERLLSKRAVYFGRQIHWECLSLSACETFPGGHDAYTQYRRGNLPPHNKDLVRVLKADISLPATPCAERTHHHLFVLWDRILAIYITTQLSKLSDRLVALRGIVNVMQEQFVLSPTTYKAGIWEPCISLSLLWFIGRLRRTPHNENDLSTRQILLRHFPSWSWASCMENVCHKYFYHSIDYDASYTDTVAFIALQGSDDKAKSTLPTELILRGWVGNVGYPEIKPASIGFNDTYFKWIIGDTGFYYSIRWDMDAPSSLDSTKALPLRIFTATGKKGHRIYAGLILKCVDTEDEIPTFMRIGSYDCTGYRCSGYDPVLDPGFELKNEEGRKQALMSAPLIRLV